LKSEPSEVRSPATLKKYERLKKRRDFEHIFKAKRRIRTSHFTILLQTNNLPYSRLGISVSKKVGGAIKRNRTKRIIREFFRTHKQKLLPSHDFLFIAHKGSPELGYKELVEEFHTLISEEFLPEP